MTGDINVTDVAAKTNVAFKNCAPFTRCVTYINDGHEEFKTIVNEKEKYEQMKESIRNIESRYELSENSKDIRKNAENS